MPRSAAGRGLKVIIAGAGGAAHLPGMAASMTRLPVLGVPVEIKALAGLDSLLSIVQMPAGVPVGTLAIGKAGAANAGLLAAAILATADEALAARLEAWRAGADRRRRRSARMIVPPGSTIGIVGGGQLGRMLALAAAQLGYRCHIYAPDADGAGRRGRGALHPRRVRRRGGAGALRPRRRRRHLRVREYRRPRRSPRSPTQVPLHPPVEALEIAQDRLDREELRRSATAAARRRSPRSTTAPALDAALGRDRHAGDPEDPPLRL